MLNIKETVFVAGLASIAGSLLFLATPRFFSSIDALYSDFIVKQISIGIGARTYSKADYLEAQNHLESAIKWTDKGLYWRQLSLLKYDLFISGIADNNDVDQSIAELTATTEIALTLMPVDPYTWYDMALIDAMYPETLKSALNSIEMSVYVDRTNRNLLKSRVLFLWENFHILDDELKSLFNSQLLLLWQLKRVDLIWLLKKHPKIEPYIFDLLLNSPEDLFKFNKVVNKVLAKQL